MRLLKSIFAFSILFLLSIQLTTAQQQQPTPLEALLYNSNTGELIAVNHLGNELERTTLPALGSQSFSEHVEVSDDGNRIAYVLTDFNSDAKDLMIYDRTQDTVVGQYRIPANAGDTVYHSLDFKARSDAFDDTNNRFAFGYSINYIDWHLMTYDIARNVAISTIDHTTHTLPDASGTDLPIPRQFDGQFINFTMIATGTEGFPEYPAYRWNVGNNVVQQNDVFRDLDSDFLRTEHLLSVPDYSLPNINDQIRGPFAQINTVYASPNNTGTTFPVYAQELLSFTRPRFIENGRRAVVSARQTLAQGQAGWHVVDRSGMMQGLLGIGTLQPHEVIGTVNGLLYSARATDILNETGFQPSPNAATTALMYIDTTQPFTSNPGTRIWLGDVNKFPELVWVSSRQDPAAPLPSSWQQITPIVPPEVVENPCLANPNVCNIVIGETAIINTTAGDVLNVRRTPSLDGEIVAEFEDETTVTVQTGPQQADGLTWWRVSTADVSGWVVENVNGIQTLIASELDTPPVETGQDTQPLTQIQVGGMVRITQAGDNLNAHTEPSLDSPVLTILQAGEQYQVSDGFVEADGFVWWELRTAEGQAWVAQGDGTDIWLTPIN